MAFTTLVPSTRVNARPARSPFNLFDAFFNDSRLPAANGNGTSFSPLGVTGDPARAGWFFRLCRPAGLSSGPPRMA